MKETFDSNNSNFHLSNYFIVNYYFLLCCKIFNTITRPNFSFQSFCRYTHTKTFPFQFTQSLLYRFEYLSLFIHSSVLRMTLIIGFRKLRQNISWPPILKNFIQLYSFFWKLMNKTSIQYSSISPAPSIQWTCQITIFFVDYFAQSAC